MFLAMIPYLLNGLVRFGYEFFLEIAVCTLLAFSLSYNIGEIFLGTLFSLIILAGYFATFLLLPHKNGPNLPESSYENDAPLGRRLFCWQVRHVKRNLEALKNVEMDQFEDYHKKDIENLLLMKEASIIADSIIGKSFGSSQGNSLDQAEQLKLKKLMRKKRR